MKKILISAPVRQSKEIFELYLKSLRDLIIPEGYQVDKLFILHNCEELRELLQDDLNSHEMAIIVNDKTSYNNENELTHEWKDENFSKVTQFKNYLIDTCLKNDYDYMFFVDSDLILDKNTLVHLLEQDKEMIVNIFWTNWHKDNFTQEMPNIWLADQYGMTGTALELWKNKKDIYPIGMGGACTLLKRSVFEKGVNFSPITNVSWSLWEDRAFCIRAAVLGIEIFASNYYPAIHLYRQEDLINYKNSLKNN